MACEDDKAKCNDHPRVFLSIETLGLCDAHSAGLREALTQVFTTTLHAYITAQGFHSRYVGMASSEGESEALVVDGVPVKRTVH